MRELEIDGIIDTANSILTNPSHVDPVEAMAAANLLCTLNILEYLQAFAQALERMGQHPMAKIMPGMGAFTELPKFD